MRKTFTKKQKLYIKFLKEGYSKADAARKSGSLSSAGEIEKSILVRKELDKFIYIRKLPKVSPYLTLELSKISYRNKYLSFTDSAGRSVINGRVMPITHYSY